MFVLSLFFSLSVFAANSDDQYSWVVQDVSHPLWDALKSVPSYVKPDRTMVKELAGIQCIKTMTRPVSTSCTIQKRMDPKQSFQVFQSLKVTETETNALHVKAKVLGPLIVRGDLGKVKDESHWRYNLSKVYFNHPCQYVHDGRQAKRCIGFWGHKIFVSYEDWNEIDMADMFEVKEGVPLITEILYGKEETHRVQHLINSFDFFAGLIEYQGELNMYYLGLKLGADAIPQIIQMVDIEDIPRSIRRQLVDRAEKEKVSLAELIKQFKGQMDDFTDKIILHSSSKPFLGFKENLVEKLEKEFPGPL